MGLKAAAHRLAAGLAGLTIAGLLAACASGPRAVPVAARPAPPPPIPARAPVAVPVLQQFPHCLPQRRASPDGARAAVGVRAETCRTDTGDTGAFVLRLVDLQGLPSPAGLAGVHIGDQIVAVDRCVVRTAGELTLEIEGIPEGNMTDLLVRRRNGPVFTIKVMTRNWRPLKRRAPPVPDPVGTRCHLLQRAAGA
jgi:hypothetical protein